MELKLLVGLVAVYVAWSVWFDLRILGRRKTQEEFDKERKSEREFFRAERSQFSGEKAMFHSERVAWHQRLGEAGIEIEMLKRQLEALRKPIPETEK